MKPNRDSLSLYGYAIASLLAWLSFNVPATHAQQTAPVDAASDPAADAASDPAAETPPAEPGNASEGRAEKATQPPKLEAFVEAVVPPGALSPGLGATVDLRLTIDAEGRVTDVEVLASAGADLDRAARDAARRFRFVPALVGGKPTPARIGYRYVFEPPPEPRLEADLSLELRDSQSDSPVVGATVRVIAIADQAAGDGSKRSQADTSQVESTGAPTTASKTLTTGPRGQAELEKLPPGMYRIDVEAAGYPMQSYREELRPGEATEVVYRLKPAKSEETAEFGATAEVDPPPRSVTRRTIEREILRRVPGTRGDPLRTIELLPGVARPPQGSGLVIIRGAAPQDSQVFLDGSPVPLLYHFQGLTSFYNAALLDQIDFYPGNFSAKYGRRTGGVIEVETRYPASDRVHGIADINLLDGSLFIETPLDKKKKWSLAAAGRRSWIDFWFENVIPEDAFSVSAAPVYWDYQAMLSYKPTSRDTLRLSGFGSSDELALLFSDASDTDPSIRGNLDISTVFHQIQLEWRHRYNDKLRHRIAFNTGKENLGFGVGPDLVFDLETIPNYLRAEWSAQLSDKVELIAGIDALFQPFEIAYRGPQLEQSEGNTFNDPIAAQEITDVQATDVVVRPALYLETVYKPTERWDLIPGLRVDYWSLMQQWSADPRFATRYRLTDTTLLKGGVGLFTQPPEFNELSDAVGNTDLDPWYAIHVSAGIEQEFIERLTTGVEGFYKHLNNRPVAIPSGVEPRFVNEGDGRIYGMEVFARLLPRKRYFAFLSYTLLRSERRDLDGIYRLFDFDQTHILTASASYLFEKGWEIGATFRFTTGNPQTPVVGSLFDDNTGVYLPFEGQLNSVRDPNFHRLDVRVAKTWAFDAWKLTTYLDVQNAYNRQNPEGLMFNYDFSQSQTVAGLPIIPSLGLRGEF